MPVPPTQDTRFLPPAVAAFLTQLGDVPGSADVSAASYAASMVLPRTRWPLKEFLPRLVADLTTPQNQLILERELQQQIKGNFTPFTLSLRDSDGERVDFLVLPRPATLPGGRRIVTAALATPAVSPHPQSTMPDIRGERARLLNLLDVLPAYVVLIDQSHVIQFDNRVFRQLFGPGQGKHCYEVLRGLNAPCEACPPFSVLSTRSICVNEWACARTNNAFRVHSYPFEDLNGNKMVLKVGINITAGVRAQHALDLSEQRYRNIADNLTIGIALLDPQLVAVTVNPRLAEWFGPEATKGTSICDMLHRQCADSERGCAACIFRKTFDDKKNHEREFSLLTHTGETRRFRLVSCPILTRKGEARAVIMMLEDITERHNVAKRMQHLRRLEAMGTLAGGIAHEINQPLSALHLYASGLQMLLEQSGDIPIPRIMERLALILAQADKIREIISHMRALVMQEDSAAVGSVAVHEAVEGALALVGAQLSAHGITLQTDVPASIQVRATRVQFEQVLINLLINAMHALDTVDSPEKIIRIVAETADPHHVRIHITDNGPGVQGMEENIFTPFFTTKEAHQGMGLGLSIVHAFVTAWGGEVTPKGNGASPGATFTLTLRAAKTTDNIDTN